MTFASTMQTAETPASDESPTAPRVTVLLTVVEDADLEAALATVRRQVYEPAPGVIVVGGVAETVPEGVDHSETLEQAISTSSLEVDYLWLLHSDARPRPDALGALVAELERNDAALGGSKLLVAGTENELESVGSATDVFGEPYSGLDEGEIDLEQYDVVREVAFVSSASMLVRRDLAQGLKGLDVLLPPIAAGLDFSQRARLAGGRVIAVPSSEVYHQGRCEAHVGGWKEQAGLLRAMVTAYRPLTLLWMIPFQFLVAVLDAIANLVLLRWRPVGRHILVWSWNTAHLPSTIGLRRRFRPVRSLGDEELFRFQVRGSTRLRNVGSELSTRVLSVFDEDQALARGSRRLWASPGIWGAVVATLITLFAVRSIIFGGVPNIGSSFPFGDPSTALDRWFGGWNASGLGSPAPVHPSVGLTGLVSWLWFGAAGAARTLMTLALSALAVVGMARFGGRLGIRGPGRYLSGLVLMAGPGTALLSGRGSWLALAGAAALPWAVGSAFSPSPERRPNWLSRLGWAAVLGVPLAAFSPALVVVPPLVVLLWKLWGGKGSSLLLALVLLLGGVAAVPFLLGDPGWALEVDRRAGLVVTYWWPLLVGVAFLPLVFLDAPVRRVGTVGALLSIGGLLALVLPYGGPGAEEAALILSSFGAAMVVAAGIDTLSADPRRLMAAVASATILALSIGSLGGGRLGLPGGDLNERLEFAGMLASVGGPGRVLLASTSRVDLPGEARPGPGFWYRLADGGGTTIGQVLLPEPLLGDESLEKALETIASGAELRPGTLLAPFAIDWVVLLGPEFRLDEVFVAQLDLVPTPLDPESRVFANPDALPLASAAGAVWKPEGAGFSGDAVPGRVTLAVNHSEGWSPEPEASGWQATVSAVEGSAFFRGSALDRTLAAVAVAWLVLGFGLILSGRVRR